MTTLAEAAEVLKEVRRKERLTQTELAARAGLARSTVTRLETLAQGDVGLSAISPPRCCTHGMTAWLRFEA